MPRKKKPKRTSPADLVARSANPTRKSVPSWYDKLVTKDREYVDSVVQSMKEQPNAYPYTVAGMLISELGLSVNISNVRIKLKELMTDAT